MWANMIYRLATPLTKARIKYLEDRLHKANYAREYHSNYCTRLLNERFKNNDTLAN